MKRIITRRTFLAANIVRWYHARSSSPTCFVKHNNGHVASPQTLSGARLPQIGVSSRVVCSARHAATLSSPDLPHSGSSPSLCFEDFVARVQQLLKEADEEVVGKESEKEKMPSSQPSFTTTTTQQARMAALWEASYHQHVFAALQDAGPPTRSGSEAKDWESFIPQDVETVPLFLICVGAAANVLSKAPNPTNKHHLYVEEMRALVLFVIYNYVPNIASLFDWQADGAPSTPAAAAREAATTSHSTSTEVVPVNTADKLYQEAIDELRVERRGREKVHELAPHLSAELLLRMTVLLDMVHSVVTTFALSLKGYALLYQALLCGLGTSAQLSNATLLVLLDCMQQCLDGYLADLELSADEKTEAGTTAEDVGSPPAALADSYDDVRIFLPQHYWATEMKGARTAESELSLVETQEQAQLQKCRGGLQRATVIPTVVLDHLHIIARVLCQRMEAQILAYHRRHWMTDGAPSTARWIDDPAREAMMIQKWQSEKGKLDFMRLEERKKVDHQSPKISQRRTLRSFQVTSLESTKNTPSKEGEERSTTIAEHPLQPAQLALCCTHLAAMRFHDDTYWTAVRRLSCLLLHSHREAAHATTTIKTEAEEALEGEEEEALLLSMKDITFALDFVNRPNDYQRVMGTLVKEKYLQKPIPPPSQYRRAMSSVKCDDNRA